MKRIFSVLLLLSACIVKEPIETEIAPTPIKSAPTPKIGANLSGDIDAATAEATAKQWLAQLPNGVFTLSIKESPGAGLAPYCFFNAGLTCNAERTDTLFIYSTKTHGVSLGFNQTITPKTTAKEAQDALNYIALDRIPPDTLVIPGWEVRPSTGISSFKEGVEIVSLKDKQIVVKVKTNLHSIYGGKVSEDCEPPSDAPTPKGCYFSIKQNIPLELTLELPMFEERSRF